MKVGFLIVATLLLLAGCHSIDDRIAIAKSECSRADNEYGRNGQTSAKYALADLYFAGKAARTSESKQKVEAAHVDCYALAMDKIATKNFPTPDTASLNKKITLDVMLLAMHKKWSEKVNAVLKARPELVERIPEIYQPDSITKLSHNLSDRMHKKAVSTSNKSQKFYYLLMSKYYWPERTGIQNEVNKAYAAISYNLVIRRGKSFNYQGRDIQDDVPNAFARELCMRTSCQSLSDLEEYASGYWDYREDRLFKGSEDDLFFDSSTSPKPGSQNIDVVLDILNFSVYKNSGSSHSSQVETSKVRRCRGNRCRDKYINEEVYYNKYSNLIVVTLKYRYSARSGKIHYLSNKNGIYQRYAEGSVTTDANTGRVVNRSGTDYLQQAPLGFALRDATTTVVNELTDKLNKPKASRSARKHKS